MYVLLLLFVCVVWLFCARLKCIVKNVIGYIFFIYCFFLLLLYVDCMLSCFESSFFFFLLLFFTFYCIVKIEHDFLVLFLH